MSPSDDLRREQSDCALELAYQRIARLEAWMIELDNLLGQDGFMTAGDVHLWQATVAKLRDLLPARERIPSDPPEQWRSILNEAGRRIADLEAENKRLTQVVIGLENTLEAMEEADEF